MYPKAAELEILKNNIQAKGRSIYYIRTEGGGVKEVANFANNSTDRLREMQMKREGVQNPEYFANVINGFPPNGAT